MANFLQTAAKALAGILGPKKKPQPDLRYSQDQTVGNWGADFTLPTETPVYTPPAPKPKVPIGITQEQPFSALDSPEVKKLIGEIEGAKTTLGQPLPNLAKAKVDPLETGLALLLSGANPMAAGKTMAVPGQLAQQRADEINNPMMANFQMGREAAQGTISTNTKLIDIALDRDAVAQRVGAQLKAKEMEGSIRKEVAQLNQNTQLIKTLANLEATGGITIPAVTAIYQQMGYTREDAEIVANEVVNSINVDPSLKYRIDAAKVEVAKDKQNEVERNNYRKTALSPNATYEDRLNAYMALADLNDPRFANMSFAEMQNAAMAQGSVTAKNEAQTKQITELLPYRKSLFQSQIGLSDNRAAEVSKRTSLMDEESAVKVAQGWAAIENLRSQIGDREADRKLGYLKLSTDVLIRSQDGLKTSLSTLATQTNTLRGRLQAQMKALSLAETDEEKKRIENDIIGIEASIKGYKDEYGKQLSELEKVRRALSGVDTSMPESNQRVDERTGGSPQIEGLQGQFKQAFPNGAAERWAPKGGRNIEGTNRPSLHNTGDALDLRGPDLNAIKEWAISQPGVKTVIYNRQIWNPKTGWRPYDKNPHLDHVHVDYGGSRAMPAPGNLQKGKTKVFGNTKVTRID